MNQAAFQLNKLKRIIRANKSSFEVMLSGVNEFNEPDSDEGSFILEGMFHEALGSFGHLSLSTSEASSIRKKAYPMILCLWEDAAQLGVGSQIRFRGKTYKVSEIKNMAEANIVADVSLEEVQDDGQRHEV